MHLSYRGVVGQSPSRTLGRYRRPSLLKQGQQLTQRAMKGSTRAIASVNKFTRKAASIPTRIDMATLLKSSASRKVLDNAALESQYHSLERSLQLAYAVNDHARISLLESEIERLTGWRFHEGRR